MVRFTLFLFLAAVAFSGCAHMTVEKVQQLQSQRDLSSLYDALDDDTPAVRDAAARALGQIGDPQAVQPILQACLYGYISEETAADALLGITDPGAIEPLIHGLEEGNLRATGPAGKALVNIGGPAVDAVILALSSESEETRETAAEVLGEMGDTRAIEPLRHALNDPYCVKTISVMGFNGHYAKSEPYLDCPVRNAAKAALKKLGQAAEE
jgi:HEAT repeat protein